MTCFKNLRSIFRRKAPKISILIPFSSEDPIRRRSFKWLLEYWKHELPDAEIIIGKSRSKIFCKGEAFNDAMSRSRGKIIVTMDADGYMDGSIIEYCANKILEEKKHGNRLWYMPYRNLYRLKKDITEDILEWSPKNPIRLDCPLAEEFIEKNGHRSKYGHRYGAMAMIFPREAYYEIGCFDERFVGWGGEDVALLRALDTLYAKHKVYKGCIYHMWHPYIGYNYKDRRWEGQDRGSVNSRLAIRYHIATRNPDKMREIIYEAMDYKIKKETDGRT